MELTSKDTNMTKGFAIIFMIVLHLFCRTENLPYTALIMLGNTPLVYYLALFCDSCVAIYCFCSGYAAYLLKEKTENYYINSIKRLFLFLINYWIILFLVSIVGFIVKANLFNSFLDFVLVFITYKPLVGIWWFVGVYIILTLSAPITYLIVKKLNFIISLLIFGAIYLLCFYFRIYYFKDNGPLPLMIILKVGTSLFPYAVGMIFYKIELFTKIKTFLYSKKLWVQIVLPLSIVIVAFIAHCLYQNLVVAPITGIITLTAFNVWKKDKVTTMIFNFLGKQSTNMWLLHPFFYATLFKDLVFKAKYPLFILLFMLAIVITLSLIINAGYKPLRKLIKKKLYKEETVA